MMEKMIMVHFGELSTKGRNKKDFIQTLARNIKNRLSSYEGVSIETLFDHIYVHHIEDSNEDEIVSALKEVSGIHSISVVYKVGLEIEEIIDAAYEIVKNEAGPTFKVITKRANKAFPLRSDDITRQVASKILKNTDLKVDVHNPDIPLHIDVRFEGVYLYFKTIKCLGGYPLGVGGKVVMMLSGGIDSPVASYLLFKRGITIECVHFASPPYTNYGVIEKIRDLLAILNNYQATIKVHVIRFTEIQDAIYREADESYCITIMRRMMYRLAEGIAKKYHLLAIASGESVGQVASQTIASMHVINDVTNYPVLRPLLTYDKEEIIEIARRIGTYEISIRPYEDCCTIFTPKNPKTKPDLEKAKYYENKFDYESMIKEALDKEEIIVIKKEK